MGTWWKDENPELKNIYPFIGEYLVTFNYTIDNIERIIVDWVSPFKRGWSSKISGANFNSENKLQKLDSIINVFKEEANKLLQITPNIRTIAQLKAAQRELNNIVQDLKYINDLRNFFVHGFWHDWTEEDPFVVKSIPANDRRSKNKIKRSPQGRGGKQASISDIEKDIVFIEKLNERIDDFLEKYRYATWNYEKPASPARQKQLDKDYESWIPWDKRGLKNLGIDDVLWLERNEIKTISELKSVGAKKAYEILVKDGRLESKRLLYSLMGAIEKEDWRKIAKKENNKQST